MSSDRLVVPSTAPRPKTAAAPVSGKRRELLEQVRSGQVAPPVSPEEAVAAVPVEERAARVGQTHEFDAVVYVPDEGDKRSFHVVSRVPKPGDYLDMARLEVHFAKVRVDTLSAEMRTYVGKLARVTALMEMDDALWALLQADMQLLDDLWRASAAHELLYFRGNSSQGKGEAAGGVLEIHSDLGDIRELLEQYQARARKANRA